MPKAIILVITQLKQLPPREKLRKERKRYNVDRLQEKSMTQQLENEINERLERNRPTYDSIEEKWTELQTIMAEAAESTLTNIEPKKKEHETY
ncbi:hypothetical protein ILUMI_26392 [Ignelater luminosus]|uniref:Uncharacterized protein n=1 Tax=Ignelater luminosus TaxID=2038154 RepID=A0A8K0FZ60_IGNLU|nr:hypothetical protein ILUMI_26392 [Ignelater luminosus]